jgi:hypothetical protein
MRRFLGSWVVVVLVLVGRIAHAQSNPSVVVVDVAADFQELDAAQLRMAIGQELTCDAVSPDDARASSARGRIDVSVDRAASELVVSYRADGATPIVRRVDLPADPEAIARAAVLLAGNIARDEAADLVAQLRKPEPVAATPPPDEELARSDRLRRLLAGYAAADRHSRLWTWWPVLGAGIAVSGTGLYMSLRGDHDLAPGLTSLGGDIILVGALSLRRDTFEKLSTYYEANAPTTGAPEPWLREGVEQQWKRDARDAASSRVKWGIVCVVLGTLDVGFFVPFWALNPNVSTEDKIGNAIALAGGATVLGVGLLKLTTETAVESRLRDYERGLGHAIQLEDVSLRIAPVSGGLTAGMGGRF